MRKLTGFLLLVVVPALTSSARADGPAAPPPTAGAPPPAAAAKPSVVSPHPVVLYIQDWEHLADVTRSDDKIFARADSLVSQHLRSSQTATSGLLVGGSVTVAAAISRLTSDHWTDFTKWGLAGGLSLIAVSMVISWAIDPDHSDLASVVNQWNERHPERPLAP